MVNGRYHVVYEFENSAPIARSYPSEEDYRKSHEDRKGVVRFHEGLAQQVADELFLRLSSEWSVKKSGRKVASGKDVSDLV